MEEIAAKLAFSKGTLYGHFKSREDLLVALALASVEWRAQHVARISRWTLRPREAFLAEILVGEILMEKEALPHVRTFITAEVLARAQARRRSAFSRVTGAAIERSLRHVEDGRRAGDLTFSQPPEVLLVGIHGLLFGAAELQKTRLLARPTRATSRLDLRWEMVGRFLDGYAWRPLWGEADYFGLATRVRRALRRSTRFLA